MTLKEQVKAALRLKTMAFDESEIEPIVSACVKDLRMAGVVRIDETDPLVARAAVLYAKANFGFIDDSEKFDRAYEALKASMSLSGEYGSGRPPDVV